MKKNSSKKNKSRNNNKKNVKNINKSSSKNKNTKVKKTTTVKQNNKQSNTKNSNAKTTTKKKASNTNSKSKTNAMVVVSKPVITTKNTNKKTFSPSYKNLINIPFKKRKFGLYEFFAIIIICLVLTVVLLYAILKLSNKEKYQVFSFNAKVMAMNAINYNSSDKGTMYLSEMLDLNLISPIKNPFNGKECDIYESKVDFAEDIKRVTLKCGEYLIDNEKINNKTYTIYKVSDWTENKEYENNDTEVVYNITKKGKLLLNDYYQKDLLIKMINEKLNKDYKKISEVKKDYKLVSKKLYRKKTKFREVTN
ncbi:MAG: hypothetical protein PUB03_05620 [bacterium]|nr:hypothetical protein [bacterium]